MIDKVKERLKKVKIQALIFHLALVIFVVITCFFVVMKFQYFLTTYYFDFNKKYIDDNIMVIALDDKTLNSSKFKRMQDVTRADYASIFQKIVYMEPKLVWVDIFFASNSTDKTSDRKFKEFVKNNKNFIFVSEYDLKEEKLLNPFIVKEVDPLNLWYANVESYNPIYREYFWLTDTKNALPFYFWDWPNPPIPLAFSMYRYINWIKDIRVWYDGVLIDMNDEIALNNGSFNINYFFNVKDLEERWQIISMIDLLEWNVDHDILKDKIVFVWASAYDIHDEFYTPNSVSDYLPWVLVHANAYNTLSTEKFLKYQWLGSFLLLQTVFVILFILSIVFWWTLKRGLLLSWWSLLLYIFISMWSFIWFDYFIELSPIFVAYVLVNWFMFLYKYFEEKKSKDKIKGFFSKYVSENVVKQLASSSESELSLWGKKKEITIFFSDLAWFTDLSEKVAPEELLNILSIYFEKMSSAILARQWTIDKFMWDAIMAFWNAPLDIENHENLACEAALLQRMVLDVVREKLVELWVESSIDMRIWINTWEVVVWNFWCSKRYDYTILWDPVNLASRLESINKQYWTRIILWENTYERIDKSKFITRELDTITVKGKIKPVKIYELISFNYGKDIGMLAKIKLYEKALELYRTGKFNDAQKLFEKVWDNPSKVFIERCIQFSKTTPDVDWDGVYRFKVK